MRYTVLFGSDCVYEVPVGSFNTLEEAKNHLRKLIAHGIDFDDLAIADAEQDGRLISYILD